MRALGIDFGEKRIGLAISDEEGRLAVPLATLARRDDRSAMAAIAEIARREGIERLVLGEPVSLDGSRGPAAARVRRFGGRLAARTALPLSFVDEALTSVEATARLRAAGVDPRRHPERVDATAAQILLQEDLDRAGGEGRSVPGRHAGPGGQDDSPDDVAGAHAESGEDEASGAGKPGGEEA